MKGKDAPKSKNQLPKSVLPLLKQLGRKVAKYACSNKCALLWPVNVSSAQGKSMHNLHSDQMKREDAPKSKNKLPKSVLALLKQLGVKVAKHGCSNK